MWLTSIQLEAFRNYESLSLNDLSHGMTLLVGPNGSGKTNLVEAIIWPAVGKSFRGAPNSAVVTSVATRGGTASDSEGKGLEVIRSVAELGELAELAELGELDANITNHQRSERLSEQTITNARIKLEINTDLSRAYTTSVEISIPRSGRLRMAINGNGTHRSRVDGDVMRATVFSPVDLSLVKDGPAIRREFLDDAARLLYPGRVEIIRNYERILKQRNSYLTQLQGVLRSSNQTTLEVWDEQLAAAGTELAALREDLTVELAFHVRKAFADLGGDLRLELHYERSWDEKVLLDAVVKARNSCVRRGLTTVGPHRDDLTVELGGNLSRTHASQGQQRLIALAMKLGVHQLATERFGNPPILILDDVLSELDTYRREALFSALPPGQSLLTSAADVPSQVKPDVILYVAAGKVRV